MRYGIAVSALVPTIVLLLGCAALESLAALQQVRFAIGGVSNGVLAGVDLDRVRRLQDLQAGQLVAIADAYRRGSMPLELTLHLDATNPSGNDLDAALERLDWRLFLNGRETVSGVYDRRLRVPAGRTVDVPLRIDLDLLELYRESRDDLIQLALQVAGADADPQDLELRATPTITTALGPIHPHDPHPFRRWRVVVAPGDGLARQARARGDRLEEAALLSETHGASIRTAPR